MPAPLDPSEVRSGRHELHQQYQSLPRTLGVQKRAASGSAATFVALVALYSRE